MKVAHAKQHYLRLITLQVILLRRRRLVAHEDMIKTRLPIPEIERSKGVFRRLTEALLKC